MGDKTTLDQQAAYVIALAIDEGRFSRYGHDGKVVVQPAIVAQRILEALSDAGYSVVKTEWEYALAGANQVLEERWRNRAEVQRVATESGLNFAILRRRIPGSWEPVPEGGDQ